MADAIKLPPLPDEFLMHPTQGECYTADQLRARDLEVARVVLEAAANVLDGECLDSLQRAILALEFHHAE